MFRLSDDAQQRPLAYNSEHMENPKKLRTEGKRIIIKDKNLVTSGERVEGQNKCVMHWVSV